MGLKEYAVEVNGRLTTLQLSDEDAKLQGLKASDVVKKANKADEAADAAEADVEAKAKAAPANKAGRQPTNKQAEAAGQALGH